jgi:hypothetical protein
MQLFDMSCVQYQNSGGNNGGDWTDFFEVEAALSQSYHKIQFLRQWDRYLEEETETVEVRAGWCCCGNGKERDVKVVLK